MGNMSEHTQIFTPQYTESSGPGSTVEYSAPYREFLEKFIRDHEIETILDLGCGDMNVMGNVDLRLRYRDGSFAPVEYIGFDVIDERIERNRKKYKRPQYRFYCEDLRDFDPWLIKWADLVIVKDVLQHWSTDEVIDFLGNCQFRRMLVTNCNYGPTVNTDIETGGWRALDLTAPPFEIGRVVFKWETKDVVLIERE
jgi:hypothetical protein